MKRKMLLLGGTGMVGTRIRELLSFEYDILSPNRDTLNLTSKKNIDNFLTKQDVDVIVYSAGITNQNIAEEHKELAMILNATVPEWIARQAAASNKRFVYFSTDAVFSGLQKGRPYKENDPVKPVNFYGVTKAIGEQAVLSASSKNLVLRLISVYSASFYPKIDFIRRSISDLSRSKSIYGIIDQYSNPTFVDVIVNSLRYCANNKTSGLMHLGASDSISNYAFLKLVSKIFGYDENLIIKTSFKDFFKNEKIVRGQYASLDVAKALKYLGKEIIKSNKESIEELKKQLERPML